MFVKIIYSNPQEEVLHECQGVSIVPWPISRDPQQVKADLNILLNEEKRLLHTVEIDASRNPAEIIYMNNNGKTIDRKIISMHPTE